MQSEHAWQERCESWLRADPLRWQALQAAASLELADWALAAGFVRNLVWDRLHGFTGATPLADIDLIYFDPKRCDPLHEQQLESQLHQLCPLPWSVRNQARMHLRNGDSPYLGLQDAMAHWPEIETAVGVRLNPDGALVWLAPFGLTKLAALRVTRNPQFKHSTAFEERLNGKHWLQHWPLLRVQEVKTCTAS